MHPKNVLDGGHTELTITERAMGRLQLSGAGRDPANGLRLEPANSTVTVPPGATGGEPSGKD
ncbi:MAG: hypothetical protein R3D55_01250 [Chloroflexota bacterium]